MSSTIQMTSEEAAAKERQTSGDVMVDSGISSTSLRLSLHGSLTSSTRSTDGAEPGERPAVKMPSSPITKAAPNALEDSGVGICQDMNQLSIGEGDESGTASAAAAGLRDDSWQEYYEQDEDGDVQLHLAIASGFVDVVYALIRMAPHPDYLSIQNHALYSPLHIAVLQNQPAVVRRLVVAGARLDVRDNEGNTPLHLAARRGNLECGEALLKPVSVQEMSEQSQGQPVLYSQLPVDVIDLCNHAGESCVHLAAMGGHAHFLRFLCWNNADMNAADGRAGRSALHFAIGAGNLEVIECLVEPRPTGCGVDVNRVDWYGRSPYQLALLNGARAIAIFLESRVAGLDTTPPSVEGSSGGSEEEEDLLRGALLLNSSA